MIAGLAIPGKPVGNMYFNAFSHNVINTAVNLSNDLKMGEYRESTFSPASERGPDRLRTTHPARPAQVPGLTYLPMRNAY